MSRAELIIIFYLILQKKNSVLRLTERKGAGGTLTQSWEKRKWSMGFLA